MTWKFIKAQRAQAEAEDAALLSEAQTIEQQMQGAQQRLHQISVARIEIAGFLKRSEPAPVPEAPDAAAT